MRDRGAAVDGSGSVPELAVARGGGAAEDGGDKGNWGGRTAMTARADDRDGASGGANFYFCERGGASEMCRWDEVSGAE